MRIIEFILKKPKQMLGVILLITIAFSYFCVHQSFYNHIDIFFEKDDPGLVDYKKFQKTYGNEEIVLIVFQEDDVFTRENINIIRKISDGLNPLDGVQRIFSLTEALVAEKDGDTIATSKLIPEKIGPGKDVLLQVREKALVNENIVNSVVSQDGKTAAIIAELVSIKSSQKKEKLLKKIKDISLRASAGKVKLHFAGFSNTEVELNSLSTRDFMIFNPVCFFLIFLLVCAILRKVSISILCQVNLLFCMIWAYGFFSLCGQTLNIVNIMMGSIILAIAVADSIHLLSHYQKLYSAHDGNHELAVENSAKHVLLPCLLTSLTTGVGFFSFITCTIRPPKIMGLFTAAGIMFAFVISMVMIPSALLVFKNYFTSEKSVLPDGKRIRHTQYDNSLVDRSLVKVGRIAAKYHRIITILLICIIGLSVFGIMRIHFETNGINYLPYNNEVRKDMRFVEKNMGGTIPFVVLIRALSPEHDFTQPESLRMIEKIEKDIMRSQPDYTTSFSIAGYYMELNSAMSEDSGKERTLPDKREDVLELYELGDIDILDRLFSPDKMETRISFLSIWSTNEAARKATDRIKAYLKKETGDNYSVQLTGLATLYLHMEANLKESQIRSLLLAVGLIFIMMFFVCRSVSLTIISMLPNVFPVFVNFAVMGFFSIPLDVTTMMISSVVLGIAVDDTIHFIVWLRRNIAEGMELEDAVVKTFRDVGRPIIITSVVLSVGFLVLVLGSILPTKVFGLLAGLSMLYALIGDLFFLPAVIMTFKPKVKGKF